MRVFLEYCTKNQRLPTDIRNHAGYVRACKNVDRRYNIKVVT